MPLIATPATVRRRRCLLNARARAGPLSAPATAANGFALQPRRVACDRLDLAQGAPAVRRRAPAAFSSRAFDRPFVLRRLFERGRAEAAVRVEHIVAMLAAPSLEAATAVADDLAGRPLTDEQGRALRALRAVALGEEPVSQLWGEDPAADALRLRLLRSPTPTRLDAIVWGLFLKWAGERLEDAPLTKLVPGLAPVVVASLAAVRGYRGAFETLAARSSLSTTFMDPLARVALRCALAGAFLPALVPYLMQRPRGHRRDDTGREPWSAALLALHAYHDHRRVAGIVYLTAAAVAADLRERLVTFAGRETAAVLRRRWWARLPPEADRALTDAVVLLRVKAHLLERSPLDLWPSGWGGPDVAAVVQAVQRLLGRKDSTLAFEVFLDDRLAVAALFAAVGYVPSAEALLAQADVASPLVEARRALLAGIARSPSYPNPSSVLRERPLGAEAERVFQRLSATPEPSIELASPHWMLGETRGALMSHLVAQGRFDAALALRPVLDRPDLRRDLSPFWILRGSAEDTAAVIGLASWLADREDGRPGGADWLRFAEDTCRRLCGAHAEA